MCKSKADGGQRCYSHTSARVSALGDKLTSVTDPVKRDALLQELHEARIELASTARGQRELREQASGLPSGSAARAALEETLQRGVELRARNRAAVNAAADAAERDAERATRAELAARLPTMTPSDIDTSLATAWADVYRADDRLKAARRDLAYLQRRGFGRGRDEEDAHEAVEKAARRLAAARRAVEPYEEEFRRRGGWSRFFETTGSNSHLHSSMDCDTCYPDTRYTWHPSLSGKTDSDAIEEFGSSMCTRCFPEAPTDPRFNQPGHRDRQAAEERATAKAERAQQKAAKAITRPDGTKLRDGSGDTINTLVTANNRYVSDQAYVAYLRDMISAEPADSEWRLAQEARIAKYLRAVDDMEQAIAFKTGVTVEEVRAAAAPKVEKKIRNKTW